MTFTIDATPLAGAADALLELEPDPVLDDAVEDAADAVLEAVRARARRHSRTGRMARQVVATAGAGGARGIRAAGPIAPIVVGGSRRHRIRPIHDRALRLGPIGFRAFADHPGTRPDPFVADGLTAAAGDIDRATADAGDRIGRAIADDIERRA